MVKNKSKYSYSTQVAILLSVIAFLLRFIYIFNFLDPTSQTNLKWLPNEINMRAEELLTKGEAFYGNIWGPYYFILAGEYKVFDLLDVNRLGGVVIVNILLASVAIFFFYKLAEKITGQRAALVSTFLLIIYYPAIYLNSLILTENLFLPLLIVAMYLLVPPPKKWKGFALGGLFLGLAAGVRTILLPFIPLYLIWLWYIKSSKFEVRSTRLHLGLFVGSILLPLVLFSALNIKFSRQHKFQLSGSTGVNMAMTWCRLKKVHYSLANGEDYWFSPPEYWDGDFDVKDTNVPFYDEGYYFAMTAGCVVDHPERLIANIANVENLFDSIFYPKIGDPIGFEKLIGGFKVLTLVSFGLFVLYPIRKKTKDRRLYWPFLLLVLSLFISVYLANPGEERYLVPYVWVLFMFAVHLLMGA